MAIYADQTRTKTASEVRVASVDFQGLLDDGELLTGTPTVAEVSTDDLTIANASVSTSSLTIDGRTVPTGEAVQFEVSGGTAGMAYDIKITASTDATPAQTLIRTVKLEVVSD